ncbi:aldose epimerase family protein [Ekhidna sp.]
METDATYQFIQIDTICLLKGKRINQFSIDFNNGLKAQLLSYGGIIKQLQIPDHHGKYDNVVLELPSFKDYLADTQVVGSLVGRYANRVNNGKFILKDQEVQLSVNSGKHHLHGGFEGFGKKAWNTIRVEEKEEEVTISLGYLSIHNEESYPGNVNMIAEFIFTPDSFSITYRAQTDRATVFNPTNHCYFNLGGDFSKEIADHELLINADQYLPTSSEQIPLGKTVRVSNSPFDFRDTKKIAIPSVGEFEQIDQAKGYDHCFKLKNWDSETLQKAAVLSHDQSGRVMEVWTTEPGIQLYTGNYLDELKIDGVDCKKHTAVCLETQHFPDSPNQQDFPDVTLEPTDTFYSKTTYRFKTI